MKIMVNGVEKTLQQDGQPISHAGLVVLAGFDVDAPLAVSWRWGGKEGEIKPREIVQARNGMQFNVRSNGD